MLPRSVSLERLEVQRLDGVEVAFVRGCCQLYDSLKKAGAAKGIAF